MRIRDLLLGHCRSAGVGALAIAHDRPLLETVTTRIVDRDPPEPAPALPRASRFRS